MKVNYVKKARKPQGVCRCGTEIKVGDEYKWLKGRYGPRKVRCSKCHFRPSDMTESKMSNVYLAQETAQDSLAAWSPEDGKEALDEILTSMSESVREVAEEYQESADNILSAFENGSAKADEIQRSRT